MQVPLVTHEHLAPNDDGWLLQMRHVYAPEALDERRTPILIVPGYGMNAFIFQFHPHGTSMERCLAEAGFEVWSVNLRAQGDSRAHKGAPPPPSMRAYADVDLPAAINTVLANTRTLCERVDLIGCSLGGSIAYAHLALRPEHRVRSLIAVGSPLRWHDVPRLFRAVLSSPRLVGMVPVMGTRQIVRNVFPVLARVPGMLDIYLNRDNVDLAAVGELTRSVDDPHPRVNREIAEWIKARDLVMRGVNVTRSLAMVDIPLLVMLSNRDGIVPESAALSVMDAWGGAEPDVIRVGDDERWFAHADLFIANESPQRVFSPIAEWLRALDD